LLYALSSQPKFLWVVGGAKHNQSVDIVPKEYAHRTVDFFSRYLAHGVDADNMFNEHRFAEIARNELAGIARSLPREGRATSTPARLQPEIEQDAAASN
jgi:hypothetical protein